MANFKIKFKKMILLVNISFLAVILTNSMILPNTFLEQQTSALDSDSFIRYVSSEIQSQNSSQSSIMTQSQSGLPDVAKGPPVPEKGYWIEDLGDQLYAVGDGSYNAMFLVTEEGVVVIDAPPSMIQKYLEAISEITSKSISHVIYSHAHMDHIGGAGMFPSNATVIAHEETANELVRATQIATNSSIIPPIPDVTFTDNMTLSIGNQTLQLDYHGINHSPGNIFIFAPKQNTLMVIDIIFPGWIPFAYLAMAKDTAGFIDAHDIILNNYNFSTLVAGHLTRLGTVDDVITQKQFIADLETAASNANSNISFGEIAQQIGSFDNPWLLFSEYIDAVDQACVNEMLSKWENKLGGANDFMKTHCFTMTEDGRINPTVMALLQNDTYTYN